MDVAVGRLRMTVKINDDAVRLEQEPPDSDRRYRNELARAAAESERRHWEMRADLLGRLR